MCDCTHNLLYIRISLARVDETPTTKQLQYLKGNGKTVRFIKAVEGEWRRLADLLELEDTVDAIIETALGKSDKACRQVMVTWLKGAHRTPVTWATLLKVLDEMERPDMKKDLETALSETHRYSQLVDYAIPYMYLLLCHNR